jgi:Response regulator containing a CheY-like receiver domain and a GGDEF domain
MDWKALNWQKKISLQIILTDIMMPGADGYDVCDTLRGDIKTSHIPIIVMSGFGGPTKR